MKLRLFEFYFIKDYLRPWFGLIYSLFFLFFLGAIGYRITEGWDWGDCLWMVLITITTIGFGEVQTLSPEGRIYHCSNNCWWINFYSIYLSKSC